LTSVTLATYSNLYTNANIVYHLHTRKTSPILFGYFYKVTVSTRSQSSRLEVAFDNYCRKQHRSYPNYFYTFGVVLFWIFGTQILCGCKNGRTDLRFIYEKDI